MNLELWFLSLLFAALAGVIAGGFAYRKRERKSSDGCKENELSNSLSEAAVALGIAFVVGFILQVSDFYFVEPTFTGSFFGYFAPLALSLPVGLLVGGLFGGLSSRFVSVTIFSVLSLILWPLGQFSVYSFGPSNATNFASLPKITVANRSDTMPPTDPQHLVEVTASYALFKASTALTSTTNSYSTRYQVGQMVLQSINNHRYYAAPLEPINASDTTWTPLFGGRSESPGYVLVDAEDVTAQPQIHDGFHMTLFDDMPFRMNLDRFLYQHGFDSGTLDNATFEVDDNYQPHWTITYLTRAFGGITGDKVSKVLVVDVAKADPVLHAYQPGDPAIKWVDRVISQNLVQEYATSWGKYGQPYSRSSFGAWLSVAFGLSAEDVMAPSSGDESIMLSYTTAEKNVWVVPMTSASSSDSSIIGVLVFNTQENKATYYPGLSGFNHGDSAAATMFAAPANAQAKYSVDNLELYNIYGHLTWVAIYTSDQGDGSTFGAIGFLDAHSQSASDVAYGNDFSSAMSAYSEKLAGGSTGLQANQNSQLVTFAGTIWRIAPVGNEWRFQLYGDQHYFDATSDVYLGAPLLRAGDHVKGDYMNTQQIEESVSKLSLADLGPNEAPPSKDLSN